MIGTKALRDDPTERYGDLEREGWRFYPSLQRLIDRFPHQFESELFQEFHRFFAFSLPSFRSVRCEKHLLRMILCQYRMRSEVKQALLVTPDKRHSRVRQLPTVINTPFGKKEALGLMVTLSLFDRFERFDIEHLLHAVAKWVPDARLVASSRYMYQHPEEEKVLTLYAEIDREHGDFTLRERRLLHKVLPQEIKARVQKLQPCVHDVRNEEKILKNMIILGQEIQDAHSLPQMMISFESYTQHSLIFTVVIVYVAKSRISEKQLQQLNDFSVSISLERREKMGFLPCQTLKEALVLRVRVKKMPDLQRQDFSLDAYFARKKVIGMIQEALGEVRDYDGGLMQKQHELFIQLEQRFCGSDRTHRELLEHFFYSLKPIEKQATSSSKILESVFSLLLNSSNEDFSQRGASYLRFFEDETDFYACVRAEGALLKRHLEVVDTVDPHMTTSLFSFQETLCAVYILNGEDVGKRYRFKNSLEGAIGRWKKEQAECEALRLSLLDHPISLDPRMTVDENTKILMQLLFEGLMRYSDRGKLECALAESVTVSEDQKSYTFKLRPSLWSNQARVLASDFAYAWKKILSPDFQTPFSFVLYCIKNAELVKSGSLPMDCVGIHVIDEKTLIVELEYPLSYFLELLVQPLFSPVHEQTDIDSPHWASADSAAFVCNGPFSLQKNQGYKGYILEKNPAYWDGRNVTLKRIMFSKINAPAAFEMYKQGKLDWIGRPMRTLELVSGLADVENSELVVLQERILLAMFNTRIFPFNSQKLRRAFALAIDRHEFTESFEMSSPAYSILLSRHTFLQPDQVLHEKHDLARKLFREALEELKLTSSAFPTLLLAHHESEGWTKIATLLQRQWKEQLGVETVCLSLAWPIYFRQVLEGKYPAFLMSWASWVDDPLYTLHAFRFPERGVNHPRWENTAFQQAIDLSLVERDPKTRAAFLAKAEKLLVEEAPVLPIIYEKEIAAKRSNLKIPINQGIVSFTKTRLKI